MVREHRIVDTAYGEVLCQYAYDSGTDCNFLDCYIVGNYDEYIGEISDSLHDSDERLAEMIEKLF